MVCLYIRLCGTCMLGVDWGQKSLSDPLGLELQITVSLCVYAGSRTRFL